MFFSWGYNFIKISSGSESVINHIDQNDIKTIIVLSTVLLAPFNKYIIQSKKKTSVYFLI